MVDERVVRVDKREVHLRHHRVRVVAGIADDRRAFGVAQHVEPIGRRQELGRVLARNKYGWPTGPSPYRHSRFN